MSKDERMVEWSEVAMKERPFTTLDGLLEMGGLEYDVKDLSIKGRNILIEDVESDDEEEEKSGVDDEEEEEDSYLVGEDTGRRTWEASVVFAKYIEAHSELVLGKSKDDGIVVEVGAGSGVVGISAAATDIPKCVVLTDLEYCHKALRRNAEASIALWSKSKVGRTDITVKSLNWKHVATSGVWKDGVIPDVVLGSEVVWLYELVEPLARTLKALCEMRLASKGAPPKIYLSYQSRDADLDEELRVTFKSNGLRLYLVHHNDLPEAYRFGRKIIVLKCEYTRCKDDDSPTTTDEKAS